MSNSPCSSGSLGLFRHLLASESIGQSVAAIEASSTARSPCEAHLRYEAHLLTPLRQVTHEQTDAMVAAAIAPCAAQVAGVRQSVVARKSFSGVAGQNFCSSAFHDFSKEEFCPRIEAPSCEQCLNTALTAQL